MRHMDAFWKIQKRIYNVTTAIPEHQGEEDFKEMGLCPRSTGKNKEGEMEEQSKRRGRWELHEKGGKR